MCLAEKRDEKAWRQSTKEVLKEDDCVEDGEKCEGFSPLLGSHWAREREKDRVGSDLQAKPPLRNLSISAVPLLL